MKSTKKALTLSVLSLVLCFTMLLGTTYAWFTDSVTSGVNQIVAGNLDIELEYTTDGTTWTPVTENTKLFNESALWEPGHTEVAYLRISNVGTLALKYKFAINVGSEVAGTNVAGETFKLSNYIKMGVVDSWSGSVYADRDAARAAVTSAEEIKTYNSFGEMAKGADAKTFAVVVFMPEDVGNEANYKTGTTAPSIELGVKLEAYQNTVEKDSFDELYDKLAFYTKEENGTYTDPETNESFITEGSELVEVEPVKDAEGTPVEGLFVPATEEGNPEQPSYAKQYATTPAAVEKAIENIENAAPEEKTNYEVVLTQETYENVSFDFKASPNKEVKVSAPTRTKIVKAGNNDPKKPVPAITVNGHSASTGDGQILIENIDFVLSEYANGVSFGTGNDDRYAHNVLIKNCTITSEDNTGCLINNPSGGSPNGITIEGCEMYSGFALASCYVDGLTVTDCKVKAVRGVNNQTGKTTISNSTFDVEKYVVRVNGGPLNISDSVLKTSSTNQEDTAIVLRYSVAPTTETQVTLSNVTISTPDSIADIYGQPGDKLVTDFPYSFIVGAPEGTTYAGTIRLPVAKIGTTDYMSLEDAAAAAVAGDVIEILQAGTYPYNDLNAINDKAVTVKSTLASNEAVVLERQIVTNDNLVNLNGRGNRATFENLTVKFAEKECVNGISHATNGGASVADVKFNNCVISGFLYGYDDMTFTDCEFVLGANESKLNMTTYGANVTYTRCTFDGSVNVYWDSITEDRKIVFDTCTFNKADKVNKANAAVFVKAAGFEAKSKKLEVEFIGEQTLNGYENVTYMNNDEIKWNGLRYISADGLWQVDDLENNYATVKVGGEEVFPFAGLTSGSFILRDADVAEITDTLIAEGYVATKGDVAGNHNNGTPYYLYTVTAE